MKRDAAWERYSALFDAWHAGTATVDAVREARRRYDAEEECHQRERGVYPLANRDDAAPARAFGRCK